MDVKVRVKVDWIFFSWLYTYLRSDSSRRRQGAFSRIVCGMPLKNQWPVTQQIRCLRGKPPPAHTWWPWAKSAAVTGPRPLYVSVSLHAIFTQRFQCIYDIFTLFEKVVGELRWLVHSWRTEMACSQLMKWDGLFTALSVYLWYIHAVWEGSWRTETACSQRFQCMDDIFTLFEKIIGELTRLVRVP